MIIYIDTPKTKIFGFTSDKFYYSSYLFEEDGVIFIPFIWVIRKHNGHFRDLQARILEK